MTQVAEFFQPDTSRRLTGRNRTIPPGEAAADLNTEFGRVLVKAMWITPEMAAAFIERKAPNRKVEAEHVRFLADQMTRGFWRFNGETLIFDNLGTLIDGQHRCLAAIKANYPFYALIVEGVAREAFDTIDAGSTRKASQLLDAVGETNSHHRAALLGLLRNVANGGNVWDKPKRLSPHEALTLRTRFPAVDRSLSAVGRLQKIGARSSLMGALHYLFAQRDPELADLFYMNLAEGSGLHRDDPERRLRERLMKAALGQGQKLTNKDRAAFTINAWNAVRDERKIQSLRGVVNGEVPAIR